MEPGTLLSTLIGGLLLALAFFPALTAYRYARDERREEMPRAVFSSITGTMMVLGLPALIGFLVLLSSESLGGGGIMSKNMGLFVLFLFGSIGLVMLWTAAICLGFVGAAIGRRLSPPLAALVVFMLLAGTPLFAKVLYSYESSRAETERRFNRR